MGDKTWGVPTDPFVYRLADRLRKVMMDDALSKSDNIFSLSQSCGQVVYRYALAWVFWESNP